MIEELADLLPLDIESLAQQSGVPAERIERYAERGLIAGPNASGTYDEADLVRLRLIRAMIDSGMAEEALFEAVSLGLVNFDFAGRMLEGPVALSPVTVQDACAQAGVDYETFTKLMLAIGFAPQPEISSFAKTCGNSSGSTQHPSISACRPT